MSLHEYEVAKHISAQDYPFYALIMAAMRQADDKNMEKLRTAFPDQWKELDLRYNRPGGILPGEKLHGRDNEEAHACTTCGRMTLNVFAGQPTCVSCEDMLTRDDP